MGLEELRSATLPMTISYSRAVFEQNLLIVYSPKFNIHFAG